MWRPLSSTSYVLYGLKSRSVETSLVLVAELTSISQYIQVPDPVITPVALARLLQHLYTGFHTEIDMPLLLQRRETLSAVEKCPSQPGEAKVHKASGFVNQAEFGAPTQSYVTTTAVNGTSTNWNAMSTYSEKKDAQQHSRDPSHNPILLGLTHVDQLTTAMRNELDVYVCAKALHVESVTRGAKVRVMNLVSALFVGFRPLTGFADVLAFIFESTKCGQDVLREEVTAFCLKEYRKCSHNAAIAAVLEEFEPSLWRIAVPLLRKAVADRDASAVAGQPTSQGPFSFQGSNTPTNGLFGNATSSTSTGNLFGASNGVNTSAGSAGFKFTGFQTTKPLFGAGTPTPQGSQNASQAASYQPNPFGQAKKPASPSATQKRAPNAAASTTNEPSGSVGSHK